MWRNIFSHTEDRYPIETQKEFVFLSSSATLQVPMLLLIYKVMLKQKQKLS